MSYRIKTVSELLNIPRNTLIAWERRYHVVKPLRSSNGYRVYSEEDIGVLSRLKELVDDGYKISEAIELLQKKSAPDAQSLVPSADADNSWQQIQSELTSALLQFDRRLADQILHRMMGISCEHVIFRAYLPILRAIGHAWEDGNVSIAQEHFVTAWIREQMISLLLQQGSGPPQARLFVCATPPGQTHEIGLLACAIMLVRRGQRVAYLGLDMPMDSLGAFAASQQAYGICLSVARSVSPKVITGWMKGLREYVSEDVLVFLGGSGVPALESLPPGIHVAHDIESIISP